MRPFKLPKAFIQVVNPGPNSRRFMTMNERKQNKDQQARINYSLPIIIKGKNIEGRAFSEKTMAENVTRRGVFFTTKQPLIPGSVIRIYANDTPTQAIAKVEVVWVKHQKPQGVGTKLIGRNEAWIKFLLQNSLSAIEETVPEELNKTS